MGIYLVIGLIGAIWAAAVAAGKNLNIALYAILGFLFPLIGVLVAYGAKAEPRVEDEP